MYTLGINAAYHDSSACLVRDGVVVAAAEEERFTGIKHGKRPVPFSAWELPFHAISYCLSAGGITMKDVNHVSYAYDPFLLLEKGTDTSIISLPLEPSAHPSKEPGKSVWDPLFLSSIINAPRHLAGGAPHHLQEHFRGIFHDGPFHWHFVDHHTAHAASAFFPSPFKEAAILTLDGRGETATTSYKTGDGYLMENLGEVRMPHSLGLLYERVTTYLGFLHSSDEYKVMALASYGKPSFVREFRAMVRLGENGSYTTEYEPLEEFFGPPRPRGGAMEKKHFDIARSLQLVLEENVIEIARWLRSASGKEDLCMAGGVALNCVMNARVRDAGIFNRVWVQPASGDNGTSLGAALWTDARERSAQDQHRAYVMDHAFLGPSFSDREVERFLLWSKLPYRKLKDLTEETARLLVNNKIVGWFQGRMEFGPRALGARSIIASPLDPAMQARLNDIKDREDFRPVAPVVPEDEAAEWFENAVYSPFMLFVYNVRPDKSGLIPAVRHVDGTARIQTIRREHNPPYYDLLKAFKRRTGVPVLVNTSFNTRGKPIVCTPRDAVECFWTSPLDALVIGTFLVEKQEKQA